MICMLYKRRYVIKYNTHCYLIKHMICYVIYHMSCSVIEHMIYYVT